MLSVLWLVTLLVYTYTYVGICVKHTAMSLCIICMYVCLFVFVCVYVRNTFTPQIKGIPEDKFAMYTSTQGDI